MSAKRTKVTEPGSRGVHDPEIDLTSDQVLMVMRFGGMDKFALVSTRFYRELLRHVLFLDSWAFSLLANNEPFKEELVANSVTELTEAFFSVLKTVVDMKTAELDLYAGKKADQEELDSCQETFMQCIESLRDEMKENKEWMKSEEADDHATVIDAVKLVMDYFKEDEDTWPALQTGIQVVERSDWMKPVKVARVANVLIEF